MSVSSNSIFHYTGSIDNLKSILSDKYFKVKYCNECISINNDDEKAFIRIAVPMVSFCDIPFSDVKAHTKSYGNYGIGLSKEWAKRNRINPVLYLEKNSRIAESFSAIEWLSGSLNTDPAFVDSELDSLGQKSYGLRIQVEKALCYMKNYSDDLFLKHKKKIIRDYVFYNEREWRFVPDEIEGNRFLLLKDEYEKNKDEWNRKAGKSRLSFEYKDISYIVLEKNSQINRFIKYLRKIDENNADLLCSKMITLEQISKDF